MEAVLSFLRKGSFWLHCVALVLLALMAYAAFVSPEGAWPLSIAAIACVFLANIDRFSEVTASTSGITATLRDAKSRLKDMQRLIEVVGEAQIYTLMSTGRLGDEPDRKEAQFDRIMQIMRDAEVDNTTIARIRAENWDRFVCFDFVIGVLGGGTVPEPFDAKHRIQREKWDALRNFHKVASPDEVEAFLKDVGDLTVERATLLAEYRRYVEVKVHPSADVRKQLRKAPRVKFAKTDADLGLTRPT